MKKHKMMNLTVEIIDILDCLKSDDVRFNISDFAEEAIYRSLIFNPIIKHIKGNTYYVTLTPERAAWIVRDSDGFILCDDASVYDYTPQGACEAVTR